MCSAAGRREEHCEHGRSDRLDVVIHGRAGRVGYRHLHISVTRRVRIDCSRTHTHTRYVIKIKYKLTFRKLYNAKTPTCPNRDRQIVIGVLITTAGTQQTDGQTPPIIS